MKNTSNIIYIVICLLICILPFAGMTVYKTDKTTENKTLAEFPKWSKEDKFNTDYFDELSAYFEDHFAFRQELVSLDAEIQSKIFKVSNVDTVMIGTDGWLYYTDTLKDYLGTDTMNERQVFNTVHNLLLMQQYVIEHGADFVFTVAPNKNSLYGEHMPYYASNKASDVKNIELLKPRFSEMGILYADLFEAFEREEEILYLKRDSHWNNKGAVLAYNTIFDSLMAEHDTYETRKVTRKKTEYGDLNKMLYPLTAIPEWNYYYEDKEQWKYVSEEQNVEAAFIETQNQKGNGTLLMFRDSFGNTLLPLMAEQFNKAAFSKTAAYPIAEYMKAYNPNLVIVEKVERNLDEYMQSPPIMPGPEVAMEYISEKNENHSASIEMNECTEDSSFWAFSGEIDKHIMTTDTKIYVRLSNGTISKCYEAFTTKTDNSDYGYLLYQSKEELQTIGLINKEPITADIIIENDNCLQIVETKKIIPNLTKTN